MLAHQLAFESEMVRADMVEAMEFQELSQAYGVGGVPHTAINAGAAKMVGAGDEDHLIDEIKKVLYQNN